MPSAHDKYARDYDRQIAAYDCNLAEVIFGLCYEEIRKGERLLDIGIGTGLSSKLFKRAGLQIWGLDGSRDMLEICRQKKIADQLTERDLMEVPWPYPAASVEHVISCGVFHFLGELEPIFAEVQRVQKEQGSFVFTTMTRPGQAADGGKYEQHVEDGLAIFAHSPGYINSLLSRFHYRKEKEITCFVGATPFRVLCARKCPRINETVHE